ncbi:MAG: FtsW/RodA/SpoVE family cell cycle protein [Flavobacteriaceae bacterium]|nr:FtsW/RodA/SpoVE family cell cycle protein [Flavobacteriaceae bacterium]
MKRNSFIQGDKSLWGILTLLVIFSFLPVFSTSSNLVYVIGKGTTWGYLFKHLLLMSFGFVLMFIVHRIPYHYFKGISILTLPVVILLLIYTNSQETIIQGANASRWIEIPLVGLSFQTSALAGAVLIIYVAHYLDKKKFEKIKLKNSFFSLWAPVFLIISLILPSNFSTAALMFLIVIILLFIGGYPIKRIISMLFLAFIFLSLFILTSKVFPELIPNRVDTWISRIESFNNGDDLESNYQIEKAKTAIASGGILGLGAGKSVMKNFLPQSSSDFIYAIIIEEFGLIGGLGIIILYFLLLFRIVVIAHKSKKIFGKLLVIGLGIPVVIQAFVNIGVALQILPVTGQNLPLISSGGTAAWITCISFGIILSVSSHREEKHDDLVDYKKNDNPIAILSETV